MKIGIEMLSKTNFPPTPEETVALGEHRKDKSDLSRPISHALAGKAGRDSDKDTDMASSPLLR